MLEAAAHLFKLERPDAKGVSLRVHLESVAQQTGIRPPDLDGPAIPHNVAHVWGWFRELNQARTSNGFGMNPLTYSEIEAWSRISGTVTRPQEIQLLKRLDAVYLSVMAKKEH